MTKNHPAFEYNTVSTAPVYYIMETGFIPRSLMGREISRPIKDDEYAAYAAKAVVMTAEKVNKITGNDILLFPPHAGVPQTLVTFKPKVTMVCSMGQGILKWDDGEPVEGSPVVDFDYQDASFDADYNACLNYMLKYNK